MTSRTTAIALAATAVTAVAAPAADAGTRYRGQWQCIDRGRALPLAGAQIELWQRGWEFVPTALASRLVARGTTSGDGRFDLEAPAAADRYFVRVVLRDARGVHLKDWYSPWEWFADSPLARNDVAVRDLGALRLGEAGGRSPKCAIWRGVHNAVADYRAIVGEDPPYPDLLIRADAPSAGTPYTPHTAINWSPGYPADDETTTHEFAHTVRHGFDGDALHFGVDAARFSYLQHHGTCSLTNPGFAFNEGWAEYWSREVTSTPACPGVAPNDFRVEGNVAAALADLERRCLPNTRRMMIDVLRRNPGRIHSFEEFATLLACRPAAPATPPPPRPATPQIIVPESVRMLIANAQVSVLSTRMKALRRAVNDEPDLKVPPCVIKPCDEALEARIKLAVLRGEFDVARLLRKTVALGADKGQLDRLASLGIVKSDQELEARGDDLRRTLAKVALKTARDVMAAARPVLKADRSPRMRAFAKNMRARIQQLRKVIDGRDWPATLTWAPLKMSAP